MRGVKACLIGVIVAWAVPCARGCHAIGKNSSFCYVDSEPCPSKDCGWHSHLCWQGYKFYDPDECRDVCESMLYKGGRCQGGACCCEPYPARSDCPTWRTSTGKSSSQASNTSTSATSRSSTSSTSTSTSSTSTSTSAATTSTAATTATTTSATTSTSVTTTAAAQNIVSTKSQPDEGSSGLTVILASMAGGLLGMLALVAVAFAIIWDTAKLLQQRPVANYRMCSVCCVNVSDASGSRVDACEAACFHTFPHVSGSITNFLVTYLPVAPACFLSASHTSKTMEDTS